jgi:hypothetical protein
MALDRLTKITTTGIATGSSLTVSSVDILGTGLTTSLYVQGQSQVRKVAITTTSTDLTLEEGRTYIYYGVGTYTLPASPVVGDRIEVINRSGVTTAILSGNGSNIMGFADDLELDVLDANFKVTYANDTDGWVVSS